MPPRGTSKEITIALGGNAILRQGGKGTAAEQFENVRRTARGLVRLVEDGDRILVTHGNGPQVGDILLKNELAKDAAPPMPLDVCGAESQGMIGYMLQQGLEGELRAAGLKMPVVTVLTQVVVDRRDPAFRRPTKPVGPFYTAQEARTLRREKGWAMADDAGRGFRRVVPSPIPQEIVEIDTVARLFRDGVLVIAAGGGGIPVTRTRDGRLEGAAAVLDKDRTAALLASRLKTDTLLILTDVDMVYLDYNGPKRRPLPRADLRSCMRYLKDGQFPPGSMGPKIESAVAFLRAGGEKVLIASLDRAEDALGGNAGTIITRRPIVLDSKKGRW
jgi:carbamate kinase